MSSSLRARGAAASASASAPPQLASPGLLQRSTSPAQATQQQVATATWHRFLWIPLICLFPFSVLSFRYLADMVADRQAHMAAKPDLFADWTYPRFDDLWLTGVALVTLLVLRVTLCKYVFMPLGDWFLPSLVEKKGKWTAEAREDRVQRFAVCMFKLCYFLFSSTYGYLVLSECNWVPPQLFGSGSLVHVWDQWPYSVMSEPVKRYVLIELSYHAHSLVFHLFSTHRNDFVEMTLHHTCATLLVFFAYFANFVRIGVMVLFLHDLADVMAYAVKAVVDSRHTGATLSAYAGLLVTWGYTRLYVFPVHVISATRIPGVEPGLVWLTSYAMLWLLMGLHVYWYALFLIMGYRFLQSGKTVDIQQKAGEQDGSYVDYHKTHIRHEQQMETQTQAEANGQPETNGHAQQQEEEQDGQEATQRVRTRSQKKSSRRAE